MLWIVIGVVAVGAAIFWVVKVSKSAGSKPSHLKDPIPGGCFRVVAFDDMGGADLSRTIGDFATFEDAQQEAAKGRADSELEVGSKGTPTKFIIYDHTENVIGDWTGRKVLE